MPNVAVALARGNTAIRQRGLRNLREDTNSRTYCECLRITAQRDFNVAMTAGFHTAPDWWEFGSPNYNPLRAEGLIRRMRSLIERDMPGKDFDALVVGVHYEDDTILMRFGPEYEPEDTGGYEEWSYRLKGDGFRIDLFESIRMEDKEVIWELDLVEGADKAEMCLRFPTEAKGIGYK